MQVDLNSRAQRLLEDEDSLLVRATAVEKDDQNRDKTVYATLVLRG